MANIHPTSKTFSVGHECITGSCVTHHLNTTGVKWTVTSTAVATR